MANEVRYYGTGRRKSSVARVYLVPGSGKITINGRPFADYIPNGAVRLDVLQPLTLTGTESSYDVEVNVNGGGVVGQAGAVRHGITRALLEVNPDYRNVLKKAVPGAAVIIVGTLLCFVAYMLQKNGVLYTGLESLVLLHLFQ